MRETASDRVVALCYSEVILKSSVEEEALINSEENMKVAKNYIDKKIRKHC